MHVPSAHSPARARHSPVTGRRGLAPISTLRSSGSAPTGLRGAAPYDSQKDNKRPRDADTSGGTATGGES